MPLDPNVNQPYWTLPVENSVRSAVRRLIDVQTSALRYLEHQRCLHALACNPSEASAIRHSSQGFTPISKILSASAATLPMPDALAAKLSTKALRGRCRHDYADAPLRNQRDDGLREPKGARSGQR